MNIDAVLENIRSTGKLEISLTLLNDDHLLKKLNESAINIHTVEIQSTRKLEEVLKKYSLPSCLKSLRITDNNLDYEDIFTLIRSLRTVKNLHELHLIGTKFKVSSFICFISVLIDCSDIQSLCLTDNGLTEEERNCLVTTFSSMKNLKNLNLTKNNLTETQANDILLKHGESKTTVSLDLSQNALQGDKIISKICKLMSLEELNLSHNHIRFSQFHGLDEESDNFFTNVKIISLSSNHLTSDDICLLPSLIRSCLVSLDLDLNHVGCSVWSLCSLRIRHLNVLSLANTDISGPAVQGLIKVLTSARQLEELNLSSNNLMLEDFHQLVSPLSSLTKLKKLNLNNNLGGISFVLEKVLPCMKYLEELRLNNTHLNSDDCNKLFESLKFLKELKYLDLSNNAIGSFGAKRLADILKEFPLLEGLDLSKCCIQEDEISALCVCLKPLVKLKYLNLSGNRINADEILVDSLFFSSTSALEGVILSDIIHGEKLFHSMIPLQFRLRKLHLSEMKLRPRDVEALATMLSSLSFLEELVLTDVDVTDSNCDEIFDAIGKIKKLKKLVLRGIRVDNKKAFFDMLSCLSVLEEIVFPEFVIDFSDTECVNVLQSLVYLKSLDLSQTEIYSEALADVLPTLQLLQRLVLGQVLGSFWYKMHLAVGKLKYLKELDLFRSRVDEFRAMALAETLPSLPLLEILVLGDGKFLNEGSMERLFLAVGKLKYLKKLSLSYYHEDGSTDLVPLTEVLPSLQFLEELTLKDLDFDYGGGTQLFHAIGKLQYLKKLSLFCDGYGSIDLVTLSDVLPALQFLEELTLKKLVFDYGSGTQLFHAIGKLQYLKKLNVCDSQIDKPNLISLAKVLPSLQWLEELELDYCQIDDDNDDDDDDDDECNAQLFCAIKELKYLKKLTLFISGYTQVDLIPLARALPSLQWLEELKFRNCFINDESNTKLFKALGNLKYLKKLALLEFRLTETDAVAALSEALVSLPLLEKLVLKRVKFDDGCDVQLFHAVGKLKYLKKLTLLFSGYTQTTLISLARTLPSLQWLEELKFRNCFINDESNTKLFKALGNLKYLKKLALLEFHSIQTDAVAALSEALVSLPLLEKLVLKCVEFDDRCDVQLFHAVGKLKYLKVLNLRLTDITQAGAVILTNLLPTLRNLREFGLPDIKSNENETSSDQEHEKSRALQNELKAAALRIPGLKVY